MVKRTLRQSQDRSKYKDFKQVAENFFQGAEAAKEFEYWNAAGVLIVHAAIAYTDALTIKVGGVKSKGEDHMAAIDLVREVVNLSENSLNSLRHFSDLINQKNLVSYSGEIYAKKDIEMMWKKLVRYRDWIVTLLDR
ncbi:MAG: hypothetical protein ACKVQC_04585 [Elusimicrobiota bacterium]